MNVINQALETLRGLLHNTDNIVRTAQWAERNPALMAEPTITDYIWHSIGDTLLDTLRRSPTFVWGDPTTPCCKLLLLRLPQALSTLHQWRLSHQNPTLQNCAQFLVRCHDHASPAETGEFETLAFGNFFGWLILRTRYEDPSRIEIGRTTVGSHPDCDIAIKGIESVQPRHVVFLSGEAQHEGWLVWIALSNDPNDTFMNHKRLRCGTFYDHNMIRLGKAELLLKILDH